MIDSRSGWFCLLLLGVILSGCQTSPPRSVSSTTIQSGYKPAQDTDEAGLWLVMDRSEQALKTSGSIVSDAGINAYLRQLLCRLAEDLCSDIRVYLVRIPHFNATVSCRCGPDCCCARITRRNWPRYSRMKLRTIAISIHLNGFAKLKTPPIFLLPFS